MKPRETRRDEVTTGKGGDLLILDDTTDEHQAVSDPSVYEKVLSWYIPWARKDNP